MSVSDLNHFMTYVIEGWMLFSAGFIGTTFVSFVSRRIQEDLEAAALAEGSQVVGQLAAAVTEEVNLAEDVSVAEAVEVAVAQTIAAPEPLKTASAPAPPAPTPPAPTPPTKTPSGRENDEAFANEPTAEDTAEALEEDKTEAARLEEVAAISEQLAKNRGKQSDSSSVSVST